MNKETYRSPLGCNGSLVEYVIDRVSLASAAPLDLESFLISRDVSTFCSHWHWPRPEIRGEKLIRVGEIIGTLTLSYLVSISNIAPEHARMTWCFRLNIVSPHPSAGGSHELPNWTLPQFESTLLALQAKNNAWCLPRINAKSRDLFSRARDPNCPNMA